MIDAKELRIGNWFWESYGGYKIVTSINCNNVGYMENSVSAKGVGFDISGQYSCEHIQPIPLTTEILELAGFKKELRGKKGDFDDIETIYYKNGVDIYDHTADGAGFNYATYTRYPGRGFKAGVIVEHLHQLQNLYFALTGTELSIKF